MTSGQPHPQGHLGIQNGNERSPWQTAGHMTLTSPNREPVIVLNQVIHLKTCHMNRL